MPDQSKPKWIDIRKRLFQAKKEELIVLVNDLYQLSVENKRFLEARYSQGLDQANLILEDYRKNLEILFFGKRWPPSGLPKLREARKLIRDYQKATDDQIGAIDLMLSYVENGTAFTNQLGDIDDPFYNSLESVLNEFRDTLLKMPDPAWTQAMFADRLEKLKKAASKVGWGYGDEVADLLEELDDSLESD
jgi:hypothetical protein